MEIKEIVDKVMDFLENKQRLNVVECHLVAGILQTNYNDAVLADYYPDEPEDELEDENVEGEEDDILDEDSPTSVPQQLPPIKLSRAKEQAEIERKAHELARELVKKDREQQEQALKIMNHKEGIQEIIKKPMVKIDKKKQQQSVDNGDF